MTTATVLHHHYATTHSTCITRMLAHYPHTVINNHYLTEPLITPTTAHTLRTEHIQHNHCTICGEPIR